MIHIYLQSAPFVNAAHACHYLSIPGYQNSGKEHWQTIWESLYPGQFTRVRQQSWEKPDPDSWVTTIHEYVVNFPGNIILVAHSLGCIATAHFVKRFQPNNIAGAFLVAPADADRLENPLIHAFAPVPMDRLQFNSVAVASASLVNTP